MCNRDVFGPLELGADTVMGMAVNSITSRGFGVLQDKVDKSPRLLGGGAKEFLKLGQNRKLTLRVLYQTRCLSVLPAGRSVVEMHCIPQIGHSKSWTIYHKNCDVNNNNSGTRIN